MTKKILVIGGTGFIGLPLVQTLLRQGHDVAVIARKNASSLPDAASFIPMSRIDIPTMRRHLARLQFDVVYDLAAFTDKHIATTLAILGHSGLRYIYLSSAAVYDSGCNIDEDAAIAPTSQHAYGQNKLGGEQQLSKYRDIETIIVRPCVVYGPRDSQHLRAHYFFHRLLHGVPILIPGQANVRNNYLYIDDLIELLQQCLTIPSGIVLNAGGKDYCNWSAYINICADIIEKPPPPMHSLNMTVEQFRCWQKRGQWVFPHNAFADFLVVSKHPYWTSQTSLQQGLQQSWQWLRQNAWAKLSTPDKSFIYERQLYEDLS